MPLCLMVAAFCQEEDTALALSLSTEMETHQFGCSNRETELCSAYTAGQMKDLATTGLGLVLFHDVKFNAKNIMGVSIGMSGAMLYSFLSYWEKNNVRSQ